MIRFTLTFLFLLAAPFLRAGGVSDVAIAAQRAWRAGDGETVIQLAHPKLISRIAELQQAWLEQEAKGIGFRPWVKFPPNAPSIEHFRALTPSDKARSFFACMHGILSDHAKFTFAFDAEDEVVTGDSATVTVVEHQRGPDGANRDVRYDFVLERIGNRWAYVSGGSERMHVDTQLMLLAS